jgi:hypothetical protein
MLSEMSVTAIEAAKVGRTIKDVVHIADASEPMKYLHFFHGRGLHHGRGIRLDDG